MKALWEEKVVLPAQESGFHIPQLEITYSPYRFIYRPILNFVKKIKKDQPHRLVAVVIPELIEPHWYEYLLHNMHATGLRILLLLERDQRTVVITTPWYL